MYKKIISVMSVALVVFLCSSFNVFATTSGGKTITSNSYSYNNGDVTTYVRVNGRCSEQADTVSGNGLYQYEHSFTVTLANNTNKFQVADTNNFTIDLYTGYADTFSAETTLTPSGNSAYRPSWSSETTSYSDNMTAPRLLFYSTGDNAGHVFISFNDSDLLVLNPNETRTYNFTIIFKQEETSNTFPINGNPLYSYFTYTGSVSMYSRPAEFTANTIDNFISNNSFPNSVIAYLLANYDAITQEYPDISNFIGSSGDLYNNLYQYNLPFSSNIRVLSLPAKLIDYDFEINSSSLQGGYNAVYAVPIYIINNFCNTTSDTYKTGNYYINVDYNVPSVSGFTLIGRDYEFLVQDQIFAYNISYNQINYRLDNLIDGSHIFEKGKTQLNIIKMTLYYGVGNYDINIETISGPAVNVTISNFTKPSVSIYSQSIFGSIGKNFADIRDRIQSILDSYNANVPAAEDVTDTSENTQDTVADQHDIESGYFEDTQTYITDTGIQNFQFDPAVTGGLGGVKDDFTAVWTSCGTLAQFWIASLTIGLALSIIRHRRMFSK